VINRHNNWEEIISKNGSLAEYRAIFKMELYGIIECKYLNFAFR